MTAEALTTHDPGTLTLADAARMMREAGPSRTWLYFVQAGANGPIKIGVSRNPRRRLASLQQANAEALSLLGLYRCFTIEEKQIHAELSDARIRGEWFEPAPSVLALAAALAEPIPAEDFSA